MLFAEAFTRDWWTEQTVTWLVFGVLAGFVFALFQRAFAWYDRRRFQGWTLITIGFDDPPQPLYWEDVRRWRASHRDLWVVVKGTLSGVCTVTPRTIDEPIKVGWVRIDPIFRQIVVDFTKMPVAHLKNGKFDHQPKGWHGTSLASSEPAAVASATRT